MKDPAFLFYSSDFLTGTMFMTDEQVGMYIRLLCAQHQKGRLTEKHMLSICKTHDEEVFSKFIKDDTGLYYNERLELEANKRSKFTESRRNNAKGGKDKDIKSEASVKHMPEHMPKHMENENENINEIKNINKIKQNFDFLEFWDTYDKKVGDKAKLKKKWDSLNDKTRERIMDHLPKYKLSQPDKKFRKDPQTYLNNKSWEDEIIISNEIKITPKIETSIPFI